MNIYKNFFIKTLLMMIILPVLFTVAALFLGNYFIGKNIVRYGESQMINQWYIQKKAVAATLSKKGPKLVFLSGSNALFGISAEQIEKATGISTLNYASHAGLGPYIFYDAKRVLKKGDTVFLPLEYDFYSDAYEINCLPSTLIEYTIAYDNDYYRQLPIKSKLKVLTYLVRLDSLTAIGKTISRQYKLSQRGDINDAIGIDKDYAKTAKPEEIKINELSANYKKWELYKFILWCKANDIKIYAFAPNIYHNRIITTNEEKSFEQIRKFYNLAQVEFVGSFKDGFFGLEDIYNTNYHLNNIGQKNRSNYFIKKIASMKIRKNYIFSYLP